MFGFGCVYSAAQFQRNLHFLIWIIQNISSSFTVNVILCTVATLHQL